MSRIPRARFVLSAAMPSDFPASGLPEVAVVGRSNVGKSSLLNRLAGVKGLAHVSRTPGRTRLINFFQVKERFYLVDLPGYGYAHVPLSVRKRWEGMVSAYLFRRNELRVVLLLIDARREPMASDLQVRDLVAQSGIPYVIVATKSDRLSRAQMARQRPRFAEKFNAKGEVPIITFSAVTNEGRKELWSVIEKHVRESRLVPAK
ncbi:MAG: ribosome biogenesis GTP-binding protein YihA/YsxC [Acidobacteriota bacterium]